MTTFSYTKSDAKAIHSIEGGFLLDLGPVTECIIHNRTGKVIYNKQFSKHVYVITDTPEDFGRDENQINALNEENNWAEV